MYKLNYKAIILVCVLQALIAIAWLLFIPSLSFFNDVIVSSFMHLLSVEIALLLLCSTFIHVFFIAWLLSLVKGVSAFTHFILVIGMWLFLVFPSYIILNLYLNVGFLEGVYLLSYGAMSGIISALILPLRDSSRSIFKN